MRHVWIVFVFLLGCDAKRSAQNTETEENAERNWRQNEYAKQQEEKTRKAWLAGHELIDDDTPLAVGAAVHIKIDGLRDVTATIGDITEDGKKVNVLWVETEWVGEYRHERRTIRQHQLDRQLVQRLQVWVKKGTKDRVIKPF